MVAPIISATVQATVLSATSNILAQALDSYRSNTPFQINTTALLRFIIFALLNTPPNFLWQQFLEDTFPGYTIKHAHSTPAEKAAAGSTKKPYEPEGPVVETKLNIRNTVCKLLLDQTAGALFNTVAFIGGMAALKGAGREAIVGQVKQDTMPLMFAGYKLWPLVSLLSFTVVPFQYRILFGGIVGVAWGIFLSLFASG